MKKLALVLGGGASKGFAHIGVIKVLEENGIRPDLIVGTSMGAVIGGMYASGIATERLEALSQKFSMRKIGDFSVISTLKHGSLMKGKKLEKFIRGLLGEITHRDLKIPFTAVATELKTGKQINLSTGKIWKNVLASSAMPAVFPSVEINGRILCDGGVKDNLPIKVAKQIMPDAIILSIDVIGNYAKQAESGGLKILTQILNMSTLYMTQSFSTELSDLNIEICQPDIKQMNFGKDNAKKSIIYGETAMKKNIKRLKTLLNDENV